MAYRSVLSGAICLIVVLVIIGTGVNSVAGQGTTEVEGAAVELPGPTESEYLSYVEDAAPGVDTPSNAFLLDTGEEQYIVATDKEVKTGYATVSGVKFTTTVDGREAGIIIADNLNIDTTGESVELSDLSDNPEKYRGQLVRVSAPYKQVATSLDVGEGEYVQQYMSGMFTPSEKQHSLESPGALGRWSVFNLSASEPRMFPPWGVAEELPTESGVQPAMSPTRRGFWAEGNATVDLAMIQGSGTPAIIANVSFDSERVSGPQEIAKRGDELQGKVVSMTASVLGSQTSSKQTLLSVARCGPDSVTNPVTGCVPVTADSVVHSGVLFEGEPQTLSDVILYAGISNYKQSEVSVPQLGKYRVTGRVVSTNQIAPPAPDGYGLMVYNMERAGDLPASGAVRDRIEEWERNVTDSIEEQIISEENGASAGGDNNTTAENGKVLGRLNLVDVNAPDRAQVGKEVNVTVTLENPTDSDIDVGFQLRRGQQLKGLGGFIVSGQTATVSLEYTPDEVGPLNITVNGAVVGTIDVVSRATKTQTALETITGTTETQAQNGGVETTRTRGESNGVPGFGVMLAALAMLTVAVIAIRR